MCVCARGDGRHRWVLRRGGAAFAGPPGRAPIDRRWHGGRQPRQRAHPRAREGMGGRKVGRSEPPHLIRTSPKQRSARNTLRRLASFDKLRPGRSATASPDGTLWASPQRLPWPERMGLLSRGPAQGRRVSRLSSGFRHTRRTRRLTLGGKKPNQQPHLPQARRSSPTNNQS